MSNKDNKKSLNTLIKATIIGILGTTISGFVAHTGSSTTMYMDFCRSLIETITTVVSFFVFVRINNTKNISNLNHEIVKKNIRFSTGIIMICTSFLLASVNILSFSTTQKEGNNIPSFITTAICVCINFSIYRNYHKALSHKFDHIIKAQHTMYRAKTCINSFVLLMLTIMIIAPTWKAVPYIDLIGTLIISSFMFYEGVRSCSIYSLKNLRYILGNKIPD